MLEKFELEQGNVPDSVLLQYRDRVYTKSNAILKTAILLGGWRKLLGGLLIVPGFIRNSLYDYIARRRYKWFGKKDTCMIPTPELQARFLP